MSVESISLDDFSVDDLTQLIDRIHAEIQTREHQRLADVRSQIEQLAASVGLSVADLIPGAKAKAKKNKTKRPAKFRHPENPALTWSGRGKRPAWLREMVDRGVELESLAA